MATQNAAKFVSWGRSALLEFAAGSAAARKSNPEELIRAETPTPTTWSLLLTANLVTPTAGGTSFSVLFTITTGGGSTTTVWQVVQTVSASSPFNVGIFPPIPGSLQSVRVEATPTVAPGVPVVINVTAIAAPIASASFNPC